MRYFSEVNDKQEKTTNDNKNWQLCYFCKRYNHWQEECCTRIQENQLCTDNRGQKYWLKRYTTNEETTQKTISPISALTSYVTPLRGNWAVLPQLLLNLCVATLANCNKLFEIFAPGEKVWPRINVETRSKTKSWLFDTGATITCMNSWSFNAAFGSQKPKKNSNAQSCVAASREENSIGVYKVDLWIKGRKFTHPVNVITELNNNIIGIDFMHPNKLI